MATPFDLDRFLADLARLVDQDSPSRDLAGLGRVADLLEARIREAGLEPHRLEPTPGAGPCLEVRTSSAARLDALLLGHMDTVFPAGTAAERPLRVEGGRARGPGVADMKGGLLLAVHALERLAGAGRLGSICLALTCDEEVGSHGSRAWVAELARASRHVLVLEPARASGALVVERKGGEVFEVEIEGRAAHAGAEPEEGRSAVEELGHWILALQALNDPGAGTTVNVGLVRGGTASNVVAASAWAEADARYWSAEEAARVSRAVAALAASPRVEGVLARVVPYNRRPPMVPTDATRRLCATIERVGAEVGVEVAWARTGGGSDGNYTAALGVPTVDGMGPTGGGCHGPDEYLEVDSIEPRLRLLEETLAAIAPARRR